MNSKVLKTKLKELADDIFSGGTPSTKEPSFWCGDLPWISSADISENFEVNPKKFISKGIAKKILPSNNLLVVTRVGLGKIGINQTDISFSQDIQGIVLKKGIHPKYMLYALSEEVKKFKNISRGATIQGVTKADLEAIELNIPNLETQKKIAQILENADIARQKRKAANALTDQFLQSTFLSMFGDPVKNEKAWDIKTFKEICSIEKEGVVPEKIGGNSHFIGLEHIEKDSGRLIGVQSTSEVGLKSTKFKFTDEHILYGKLRPYLNKVCIPAISGICSTDILPIKPKKGIADKYFIAHLMKQPFFIEKATSMSNGANLPRIAPKILESFDLISPPFKLQQNFASIVADTEKLHQKQKQSELELENLFQSLLQKYFG